MQLAKNLEIAISAHNLFGRHLSEQEKEIYQDLKQFKKEMHFYNPQDKDHAVFDKYYHKLLMEIRKYDGSLKPHFENKLEAMNEQYKTALGYNITPSIFI